MLKLLRIATQFGKHYQINQICQLEVRIRFLDNCPIYFNREILINQSVDIPNYFDKEKDTQQDDQYIDKNRDFEGRFEEEDRSEILESKKHDRDIAENLTKDRNNNQYIYQ